MSIPNAAPRPPTRPVARLKAWWGSAWRRLRAAWERLSPRLASWSRPEALGRSGRWLLPLLLLLGLLLPPVSLLSWLRSWTYARVRPGVELRVPVRGDTGAHLLLRRNTVLRTARLAVFASDDLPSGTAPLPGNPALLGAVFRLDIRGPLPQEARLVTVLNIGEGDQPFVDPFGWDGQRWHWLPVRFTAANLAEVYLPLAEHDIRYVAITEAPDAATSVAASLLPPPAPVPAAIASLPILELPAYTLKRDDGSLASRRMSLPSRRAARFGVIDNREGERRRSDLATNVLVQQGARLRMRQAIVAAVRHDDLRGVVMDFQGLPPHVQGVYADWLGRLRQDLEAVGAELIVAVPMPRPTATGWDSSPLDWRTLGRAADGLRILLPNDAPLATDTLDAMIRWALQSVERRKLQLAVPVEGRDEVEGDVHAIGYSQALGLILDLAAADLPERVDPGQEVNVDLPTLRAAEFGRDPDTGMWRFYHWDANRRQHTVWLNDAGGLAPAFEIARRYRMDRIALSGVAAGLDPAVWTMVKGFIADGSVVAPLPDYSLQWTLLDADGRIALQALRPMGTAGFAFTAPRAEGRYRLTVSLTAEEGRVAALGRAAQLSIAPPPPPTPTATPRIFTIEATAAPVETAPPPADELRRRTPITAGDVQSRATFVDQVDAVVSFREATLRAGPATSAEIKSGLKVGDQLQVLGQTTDGRWLSVRQLGTGLEGWILSDLLDIRIPREGIPYLGIDGTAAPLGDAVVTDTPTPRTGTGPTADARPSATRAAP
jgi:hypothetical protein